MLGGSLPEYLDLKITCFRKLIMELTNIILTELLHKHAWISFLFTSLVSFLLRYVIIITFQISQFFDMIKNICLFVSISLSREKKIVSHKSKSGKFFFSVRLHAVALIGIPPLY